MYAAHADLICNKNSSEKIFIVLLRLRVPEITALREFRAGRSIFDFILSSVIFKIDQ